MIEKVCYNYSCRKTHPIGLFPRVRIHASFNNSFHLRHYRFPIITIATETGLDRTNRRFIYTLNRNIRKEQINCLSTEAVLKKQINLRTLGRNLPGDRRTGFVAQLRSDEERTTAERQEKAAAAARGVELRSSVCARWSGREIAEHMSHTYKSFSGTDPKWPEAVVPTLKSAHYSFNRVPVLISVNISHFSPFLSIPSFRYRLKIKN